MSLTDTAVFGGRPVVVIGGFAAYDYGLLWQRQQRIVARLARDNRLVYLERLGARTLGPVGIVRAVYKRLRSSQGVVGSQLGTPRFVKSFAIPLQGVGWADRWTARMAGRAIERALEVPLNDAVCVCFFPAGYSLELLGRAQFKFVAYDAVQFFAALPTVYGAHAGRTDSMLARTADFNSTDTRFVERLRLQDGLACTRIPQGVDPDWATRARAADSPTVRSIRQAARGRRIAGFVGGMGVAFDWELVRTVARELADVMFVMVGPVDDGTSVVFSDNVIMMPAVPAVEVPAVMAAFDVGLVPYLINAHTEAVLPTKLTEYVGAGVRVVSTCLPEVVAGLSELPERSVTVAESQDFADAVTRALDAGRLPAQAAVEVIKSHSWESLLDTWLESAQEAYERAV